MNLLLNLKEQLEYYRFKKLAHQSWSQYGEDLIIDTLLMKKEDGFFIDVGAYHPFEFSNTYKFYRRGWRGINIDANKEAISLFDKYRKRDINICAAVSEKIESLTYVKYEGAALNHLSNNSGAYENSVEKHSINTSTLSSILDYHMPKNISTIDFMSIDVEGFDLAVLMSNNWDKYKPKIIVIEDNSIESIVNLSKNPIFSFLDKKGYELIAKLYNTLVFTIRTS